MGYSFPTEVKLLVAERMQSGNYASEDEVLIHALRVLSDYEDTVTDIQDGISDEAAGRVQPLQEAADELRDSLGFSK